MSFFRRKEKNEIPPVVDNTSSRNELLGSSNSQYRSPASTYVASRDGDLYNKPSDRYSEAPPQTYAAEDKYRRNAAVGDVYSRGGGQVEAARSELFSGYKPEKTAGSGRFFDGPKPPRDVPPGEENDEDVEGIKQQTKFIKQESVSSSRNALRMAREAEETARNTLTKLGDQSEKLANTERHLDVSKGHSARANDKTDELKQLNRSIFRPVITFNKDGKRKAQEAKVQARYDEERDEREKAMLDIRETQNRLGRATTYGRDDEEAIGGSGRSRFKSADQLAARNQQRKRYQFEEDDEDNAMEDELDDNLDEISDMTKRLKALGSAMGEELDKQNKRIERIETKTVNLDNNIFTNTKRLEKIK